jgi:hypothetical protein
MLENLTAEEVIERMKAAETGEFSFANDSEFNDLITALVAEFPDEDGGTRFMVSKNHDSGEIKVRWEPK